MSKDSSNKYYQDNKEGIQNSLSKDIKVFAKKKKSDNMGTTNIKFSLKMKRKLWLSIEKYYKMRKTASL